MDPDTADLHALADDIGELAHWMTGIRRYAQTHGLSLKSMAETTGVEQPRFRADNHIIMLADSDGYRPVATCMSRDAFMVAELIVEALNSARSSELNRLVEKLLSAPQP